MALITFEGFDAFAGGGNLKDDLINCGQYFGWTCNPGPIATGSKVSSPFGGSQWASGGSSIGFLFYNFPAPLVTSIVGMRINIPVTTAIHSLFLLSDSSINVQIGVCCTAAAKLAIYRNDTSTILATGTTTIVAGAYYYLELKSTIDNSVGSVQLQLNGVTEINVSGIDTQNTALANVQQIQWRWVGAELLLIDDFYLEDTTGPAPYNNFLCDPVNSLRVETLFALANSSVTFTPASSTNVSQIKEVDSDNDATYNATSVPNIDIFTHGALSSTPQQIFAVNVMGKLRSDDVTNMQFRNKLVSGAVTSNGLSYLAPTVYQYIKDQYVNDPNTAAAWTATAVNNSLIGYERVI